MTAVMAGVLTLAVGMLAGLVGGHHQRGYGRWIKRARWRQPAALVGLVALACATAVLASGTPHSRDAAAHTKPDEQQTLIGMRKAAGNIFVRVVNVTDDPHSNYAADDEAHARPARDGDILIYQVTVTNDGQLDLTNVQITDLLPDDTVLIKSPGRLGAKVNAGTIKTGANYVVTFTARFIPRSGLSFVANRGCFTADPGQQGCDLAYVQLAR